MERKIDIDLIKALAIFGVITIHTCSGGFTYPIASFNWVSALFWNALFRPCVPLFLMCSGALFLPAVRQLSIKDIYRKYILRIVVAMLAWSMLYKVYHLLVAGSFSFELLLGAVKQVLLLKQEFHFYYLHMVILFYAFLPLVRILVQHATKKELHYVLLLWFLVGILYPTVKTWPPFNALSGIPAQWLLNMAYSSIGYGLLGYYLKAYEISLRTAAVSFLSGFALVFGGTFIMSVSKGALYDGFLEGMSVGVALMAVGVFALCVIWSKRLNGKPAAMITFISKASFCIYLVHVFFIYLLPHFNMTVFMLPTILSIPAISALNLILCSIIYWVLAKIPIVKKWLI